ncbi:DUF3025 domain-containing protein [Pseudoalteromonas xiamenensis]
MKRFNPSTQWQPDVFLNPVYATLNALFNIDKQLDWPSCDWLNRFVHATVGGGQTVEFVENAKLADETRYYEAIIYETGQVPTREENWHDSFWCIDLVSISQNQSVTQRTAYARYSAKWLKNQDANA